MISYEHSYTHRIADLNNDDKPREKAMKHGIRSLSDTELIAIIFGGGVPGKSAIDLSKEVLSAAHNSLNELAGLSIMELCRKFRGVGPAKAVSLAAALELGGRRHNETARKQTTIRSSTDAYNYIRSEVETLATEEFWILILSRANHIRHTACISAGGTNSTYVEPKMVMKIAIDHKAAGIILIHNHPSGNLHPSEQDDKLTQRIKDAGNLLDIKVLDHLIISVNGYYSYADECRL